MEKYMKRLDQIVEREKQLNEYDYQYVMKSLEKAEIQDKKKLNRLKKLKKVNKHWKDKLNKMKLVKNELNKEHKKRIIRKMKTVSGEALLTEKNRPHKIKKNNSVDNIKNVKQSEIISNNTSINKARQIIEKLSLQEEIDRLNIAKSVEQKLNKFSKRHLNHNKEIKNKYENKYKGNSHNYLENLKMMEEENILKIKVKEAEKAQKFKNYYEYLKLKKFKSEEIKSKEKQKFESLQEKLTYLKKLEEDKKKQLIEKISQKDDQKKEKSNVYSLRIDSLRKKENEGLRRYYDNIESLVSEQNTRNKSLLEKEKKILKKTELKERSLDLNKKNAMESTLITQLELEKKFNEVNSKLNFLKDDSIFKKSNENRKDAYLEIKRLEEEEIRKKEEERLKALRL